MIGDVSAAAPIFEQDVRESQRGNDQVGVVTGLQRLAATRAIQGALREAHEFNRKAVELAVDARSNRLPVAVKALAGLGDVLREWNDLEGAEAYARESIQVAERWSSAYGLAGYLTLARIQQALGEVQGARQTMDRAVELARGYDATELDDIIADALQARLSIMLGDREAGERWAQARGLEPAPGETLERCWRSSTPVSFA